MLLNAVGKRLFITMEKGSAPRVIISDMQRITTETNHIFESIKNHFFFLNLSDSSKNHAEQMKNTVFPRTPKWRKRIKTNV